MTHSTEAWYVGFVPCPNRGIYRLATGRFGHCMAFRPVRAETPYRLASCDWLLVEHNVWGADVQVIEDARIRRLMALCVCKGILFLSPPRRRPQRTLPAPLLTCSSLIGALVGLKGWYFTPWQLYRALQRSGARVVMHAEETA